MKDPNYNAADDLQRGFNFKPKCEPVPLSNESREQAAARLARLIEHTKYVNEIADRCEG